MLTSTGLRFAPHPAVTFADRQKYLEQNVINFYERAKVDYEVYLAALEISLSAGLAESRDR